MSTTPIGERGIYSGQELSARSARPGAYDALKLPSRIGDRMVTPGTALEQSPPAPPVFGASRRAPVVVSEGPHPAQVPPPAPAPAPAPAARAPRPPAISYNPRPGKPPGRVIDALRRMPEGSYLMYPEVEKGFDVKPGHVDGVFLAAINGGALLRVLINGRRALALPSFANVAAEVQTPREPEDDQTAAEDADEADRARYRLQVIEAERAAWQAYVTALQVHVNTPVFKPPFTLTAPPRFHIAA